ncbi:hypothetical protein RJ639_017156 [Escallonia herrerae]|uniref:Uncharacterized protein n=1 Tax=Escallonia herrerae TaxID=1293975 RepID=A0AA88VER7_9ASTE|nr:hypothetical protein RJ639_017156 [Escallonia herrerae]
MPNCSTNLPFITPSGTYKVQGIDYNKKTPTIYDPSMSTCSILQPHHNFVMSKIKSVIIPPTPDTVFTLLNCSRDSSVLNHYRSLCFNFSGHSCDELYGSCTSFRLFHLLSNNTPPCCFTGYDTVKYMSMNILDCTHYTTMYNTDGLHGVAPLDWIYGIKLSYSVPVAQEIQTVSTQNHFLYPYEKRNQQTPNKGPTGEVEEEENQRIVLFSKPALLFKSFTFSLTFSSFSTSSVLSVHSSRSQKWRQPVVSTLDLGGVNRKRW